jgi:MarR family 2-MHQ and catechol resistance regulon transcriptional repressor
MPNRELSVAAYVRLVRTAETLHAEVSRGLLAEGLTASQFSTMKALMLQGPLAQRDIAKYLLKTGGNVTVVVDNLERMGLVTRIRDTEDRRIVFVKLTAEGEATFHRVYPGHKERINAAVAALSEFDCERLLALLDKLPTPGDDPVCALLDKSLNHETTVAAG